ncbi:MAG TPA: hypothetical protein VD866_21440 [Urbifossiella sp.]|nr:hypothetical protein [Urbifossiella sp.]
MTPGRSVAALGVLVCSQAALLAADGPPADPARDRPVVRVAYLVPTDRRPEPDYRARLDRVMSEVQQFYRTGMEENGHGKRTFELDRDAKGALRVHEVHAKGPMRDYGRDGSDKVRREVKAALAKEKIDADAETVVIFQLLLDWRGDNAEEIGPFVGGGGPRSGTAWVYDDAKLDPRLLPSREPGGYYHGPCSLGQFNTHYVGGVVHELGHAFGLPHDCERDADRPRRGRSLMGGGNHTYGQERRGEGKGAFLSAASALPLSVHPLFTGKRSPVVPLTCRFAELKAAHDGGRVVLTGRLQGSPRAVGLVARNDPAGPAGDYDAVGWTCPVGADGAFRLEVGELKPGEHDLRLAAYTEGGDARPLTVRYRIDPARVPDLRPFEAADREFAARRPEFLTPERRKRNLLAGGTFEDGAGGGWAVRSYRPERDAPERTTDEAKEGKSSLVIRAAAAAGNDIAYVQKVAVRPGTRYLLSGWAKTKNVAVAEKGGATGATLGVFGRFESSESLVGDQGWTFLTLVFDSGRQSEVEVGARLGHNGSVARGSAWFDDLVLLELGPSPAR